MMWTQSRASPSVPRRRTESRRLSSEGLIDGVAVAALERAPDTTASSGDRGRSISSRSYRPRNLPGRSRNAAAQPAARTPTQAPFVPDRSTGNAGEVRRLTSDRDASGILR